MATAQERFEVLSRLGAGGMGTVHEAYDRVRGERVALKTFHGLDPWKLYCLKNEFRSLADVVHPNLVALHELVHDGRLWMLVMERVEGVTLDRWVRVSDGLYEDDVDPSGEVTEQVPDTLPAFGSRPSVRPKPRGRADERHIRESFQQMAAGIVALHQAGKLHRDLKPSNVLVRADGHVIILDFGLVIDRDDAKEPDPARVAGTFEYLSPERIRGEPATEASDWYALGVMLYEALTGVLPYEGSGPASALLRARGVEPKPPRELAAGVPDDLEALCMSLMRADSSARPSGREILARLSGARTLEEGDVSSPSVLLGRDAELERLEAAFKAATRGELRVLRIVGPSGVGKTALLEAFARTVQQRGDALVFKSRCLSAEASSYKGVDGIIDALSMHLSARTLDEVEQLLPPSVDALALMFPVLRRVKAVEYAMRPSRIEEPVRVRRRRAVEALGELLSALARERPLMICIDDLQWGDDDGARLWLDLLAERCLNRMLFVSIARGAESDLPPSWRAVDQQVRVESLSLGPLSLSSASALAGMLLRGTHDDSMAARVAQVCGGHPILLMQLAAHVRESERSGVSEGDVNLSGLVYQRLARLPDEQRELVEVLSLVARPLSLSALRIVCGTEVGMLSRPLGQSRWVRALGAGPEAKLEMFHDRLREHVIEQVEPPRRKDLHARIARGLAGMSDADPELLSYHFAQAGAVDRARHEAERAGNDALSAFAFERASRMFERALSLLSESGEGVSGEHRRRLLLGLASALEGLGRGHAAAENWAAAAALTADPEDALDLRRRAAEQWLVTGHIERGLALLDEVAAAVSMTVPKSRGRAIAELVFYRTVSAPRIRALSGSNSGPPNRQARLRADASFAMSRALCLLDTAFAYALQARALWHSLESGDPQRICQGLAWEASLRGGMYGPDDRGFQDLIRRAEEASSQLGSTQAIAFCGLARGCTLVLAGQYRAGIEHLERADQMFSREPNSITWELTLTRVFRAAAMCWVGDYQVLNQQHDRWLADAIDRGDGYANTVLRLLVANGVRFALRDDPEGLLAEVDELVERWPNHPMAAQVPRRYGDWLRAFAHLMRGDAAEAALASARLRASASVFDYMPPALRVELDYLEGLVLLSQPEVRVREVKALERRLAKQERRFGPALSAMLEAARCLRTEDQPQAAFARAQAACDAADMRGFSAIARWARGVLGSGQVDQIMADDAATWLLAQGARSPDRFARLWVMPWTLAQVRSR